MISYLVDEYGKRTHAVIPIDEWEAIQKLNPENQLAIDLDDIVPFMGETIVLLSSLNSADTFQNDLQNRFAYFQSLSANDIALLYLIRSPQFEQQVKHHSYSQGIAELLFNDFKITGVNGEKLSKDAFQDLKKIYMDSFSNMEFLQKFMQKFSFGKVDNKKRIRRDAELKRIVTYDLSLYISRLMKSNPTKLTQGDDFKTFLERLVSVMYPNSTPKSAMAQMNKALDEAKKRIHHRGWQEYLE